MNTRAVKKANQVIKAGKQNKKKPTVAQSKVIRQIKQDGKVAAKKLKGVAVVVPTKKAMKAARTALIQHGVEIPQGYTLQLVPPAKQQPATKTQKKPATQQTKQPTTTKRNTKKR